MLTKQYDKAIHDFDAAISLKRFSNSRYARGWAKRKIGDIAGGNRDIAQAKADGLKDLETWHEYYGIAP